MRILYLGARCGLKRPAGNLKGGKRCWKNATAARAEQIMGIATPQKRSPALTVREFSETLRLLSLAGPPLSKDPPRALHPNAHAGGSILFQSHPRCVNPPYASYDCPSPLYERAAALRSHLALDLGGHLAVLHVLDHPARPLLEAEVRALHLRGRRDGDKGRKRRGN